MTATRGPEASAPGVELAPPDIARYRDTDTGVPYVHRFDSGADGPHAVICALTHGNEISGAIALDHLLRHGIRPARGRLTLIFVNTAAFGLFDTQQPHASRYVDEDMNRLWQPDILDRPSRSLECRRAREIWPFIDEADYLLDLHSMLAGDRPIHLCGPTVKGRRLARRVGGNAVIVSDHGHPDGTRMRDYGRFNTPDAAPNALLAECGAHWKRGTADMAIETAYRFLSAIGLVHCHGMPVVPEPIPPAATWIEVSDRFVPETGSAAFIRDVGNLEVIADAGTVFARDGDRDVATAFDDCVLVMPARRLVAGQTAVRLGRLRHFGDHDD